MNRQYNDNGGNNAQSSFAPPYKAASRRSSSGAGARGNHLYTITSHQDQKHLLDVFTGMIQVPNLDVYAFLDQGVSLCFVTLYTAMNSDDLLEKLLDPIMFLHLLISLF